MNEDADKKEILKTLINRLYKGAEPEDIKKEFKEKIKAVTSAELEEIKEEITKEGISKEAFQKLWEGHLAPLSEAPKQKKDKVLEEHPVQFLMDEHSRILKFVEDLKNLAKKIKEAEDSDSSKEEMEQIRQIKLQLKNTENHYLREEKVFFPYLERHGISKPPTVMRMEHDQIRETEQIIFNLIDNSQYMTFEEFKDKLEKAVESLSKSLSNHFFKENNLLFPSALNIIEKEEYKFLLEEFNKIGSRPLAPDIPEISPEEEKEGKGPPAKIETEIAPKVEKESIMLFETGKLSQEEIKAIFNSLPLDITFIDKDDTVQYFNQIQKRIFKRTKEMIGQNIQEVFPEINIQLVNNTLKDFKSGLKEAKLFWLKKEGRDICIRYFPLHNKKGEYIGCLETAQKDHKE